MGPPHHLASLSEWTHAIPTCSRPPIFGTHFSQLLGCLQVVGSFEGLQTQVIPPYQVPLPHSLAQVCPSDCSTLGTHLFDLGTLQPQASPSVPSSKACPLHPS